MNKKSTSLAGWKKVSILLIACSLLITFACTEEKLSQDLVTDREQPVATSEEFRVVEEAPSFPGGIEAFYRYIMQEIRYPAAARLSEIQGTAELQFVIERDGSIGEVAVLKSVPGCDKEAIRVLQNAPKFSPGRQRGRAVRTRKQIPIQFKLEDQKGVVIVGEVASVNSQLDIKAGHNGSSWSGHIYDSEGNPLPGASILVVGTVRGTVSDLDGSFELKAADGEQVVVSFVGFESTALIKEK